MNGGGEKWWKYKVAYEGIYSHFVYMVGFSFATTGFSSSMHRHTTLRQIHVNLLLTSNSICTNFLSPDYKYIMLFALKDD